MKTITQKLREEIAKLKECLEKARVEFQRVYLENERLKDFNSKGKHILTKDDNNCHVHNCTRCLYGRGKDKTKCEKCEVIVTNYESGGY